MDLFVSFFIVYLTILFYILLSFRLCQSQIHVLIIFLVCLYILLLFLCILWYLVGAWLSLSIYVSSLFIFQFIFGFWSLCHSVIFLFKMIHSSKQTVAHPNKSAIISSSKISNVWRELLFLWFKTFVDIFDYSKS